MSKRAFRGLIAFLIFFVAAWAVVACGYLSRNDEGVWFSNSNFSTWHWRDKVPEPDDTSEDNIQLMTYRLDAADFEAYGISPQALEAKVIMVDFEPANTTNKRIGWVGGWKNPYSDWARNKDWHDYFDFVPAENYGASATLAVKQPFGEPFVVKATSRANPQLTSSCQFDYVARYSSIWGGEDIDLNFGDDINVFANLYTDDVYTVVPESLVAHITVSIDDDLGYYVNNNGGDISFSIEYADLTGVITWDDFFNKFGEFSFEVIAAYANESGNEVIFNFDVEITCVYTDVNGGKVVYTFSNNGYYAYLSSACLAEMATPPTDITVNGGGAF